MPDFSCLVFVSLGFVMSSVGLPRVCYSHRHSVCRIKILHVSEIKVKFGPRYLIEGLLEKV